MCSLSRLLNAYFTVNLFNPISEKVRVEKCPTSKKFLCLSHSFISYVDCPQFLEREVASLNCITTFTYTHFHLLGSQVSVSASGVQPGFSCTRSSQRLLEKPLCLQDILLIHLWFVWSSLNLTMCLPLTLEPKCLSVFLVFSVNVINPKWEDFCLGRVANLGDFTDWWMTTAYFKHLSSTEAPFCTTSRAIMS